MVLQSIRERLTGIIAIFIFGILIIPFAFVGVSSYFTSDAVNAVAVVNDQEITINEFNASFQSYRLRMQRLMGTRYDPEQFDQPIVRRQHLDNMIDQELLAQASLDAGLAVDDERLAEAIRNIEVFQVDGEFNRDVYLARVESQGSTPRQFENQMRSDLVMNQFPATIIGSSIATNREIDDMVRLQEQERAFKAIIVPAIVAEDEPAEPELADESGEVQAEAETGESREELFVPDEASITAWYDSHPDDYLTEEQVIIEYLELDASTMGDSIEPDEEQLRARFEEQKGRFITPESRLASHILIEVDPQADELAQDTARQRADDLATMAREGADFAELAAEHSQDAGSAADGGDLGWVEPGFMVQAFEDGLYALSLENPISDPVQTGFGWHVILLREIRPAEGMGFNEAREILLGEYQAEADERRFLEQADRMVDLIYEDPTTLEAAASEIGLEVQEAGPFGRAGGDGIAGNSAVVNAAFSDLVLLQGSVSDPVDLDLNHMVMIRLQEHLPESRKPLEEVREEVIASLRHERAMQEAASRAEELLASLSEEMDISSLAETSGLELVEAEAAKRNSMDIPAELRDQVFDLDVPEEIGTVTSVIELSNGYALVQLDSVTDGALGEEDLLQKENYRRRIQNGSANSEAMGFVRMLRNQSVIEVYEDRL
jgi:peptidyl-prolyl cis-trans isomerase D